MNFLKTHGKNGLFLPTSFNKFVSRTIRKTLIFNPFITSCSTGLSTENMFI